MRIIHIISNLDDGGAEAVLYRLCCADIQHQHTVVSLMDQGKYGPLLREIGVAVQCLEMPRGRMTLKGLFFLWRWLRRIRPDVVQTWMYHADLVGGVMARLAGVRAVFWGIRHSDLELGKNRRLTIMVARICAWLSKGVPRRIVCCAHKAAEVHVALGYDAKKFVVIPNGYDLSVFQPNPAAGKRLREALNVPAIVPLIGMVGRFNPQKDHAGLIAALGRAAASGQNFHCILVGTGMEERNADLQGWIAAAGLTERIGLLGRRNDIPAIMNALDVHVLSSSFGEAFPNVLAEAMACGTPCVTTDVGDAALIVGDTGWVRRRTNRKHWPMQSSAPCRRARMKRFG